MRVIYTIDYSPWSNYGGGAQRSTHNLAAAMSQRGHDVHVVYTKPPWEQVETPNGLPYTLHWAAFLGLKSRRRAPLRPLNAFSVARTVRELLNPAQANIVHSHGEEGGQMHRLRPNHRFGFIATPRHPHYPAVLLREESPSWIDRLRLFFRHGKYLMQGSAARHADLVVPPSAFAAGLVQRAFGVPNERLRVVHNGVPEEFLDYRQTEAARRHGPLVFFGRFEPTKGIDTLVEALGRLGDEAPPTRIIGRGPERDHILQRTDEMGLADRVELAPWMTHHELGDTLSEARMVALPSREENFSLAILGAMAVGPPTISTRVGGTPEIITDGETGLLVPPDDPEALAGAIRQLLEDPARARRLGMAGRRRVREELTWADAAERFEALYKEVQVNRSASTPSRNGP